MRRILKEHSGPAQVYFKLTSAEHGNVMLRAGDSFRVDPSGPLIAELQKVLGERRVSLN